MSLLTATQVGISEESRASVMKYAGAEMYAAGVR